MFQFPGFASSSYGFTAGYPCGWVSPFGHRGIKARCQLPHAFRRLPRPSSPLTAKASTVCAYSLDHITSSRLEAGASSPCYNDTCFKMATRAHAPLALKRCYVTSCQRTENRPQRRPRLLFCTRCHSELVGLGGLEPPTSPLSGVRSNHLSYRPVVLH